MAKQRQPWGRFAIKALLVSAAAVGVVAYASDRYAIGTDTQEVRCLPDHSVFLVDRHRVEPRRDTLMAFRAQGLDPYFEDGTLMAKELVGMPGDHVRIDETGVWINGEQRAEGFPHVNTLDLDFASLERDEAVPEGHYLFLAPAPESYDGRYWGYVSEEQLAGRVHPLY